VLKRVIVVLMGLLIVFALVVWGAGRGWFGSHEEPGRVTTAPRPPEVVASRAIAGRAAAESIGVAKPKQILFGDLHVHTTFSADAFMTSLPIAQGEGAHPPADACDFARYCSALDFWSINDHAEATTPRHWRETVETIRQCNGIASDPANPDTVAFLGWEWTQIGTTPENHYGHKNVVLAHTEDDKIPARPIASPRDAAGAGVGARAGVGLLVLLGGDARLHDFARYIAERRELEDCPADVNVHELPDDCRETAATPGDLYRKLDEWGHDAIVIPHGTTWGFYTPPGSTWDKQLTAADHDPDRQVLLEIYSGHGDSDVYRDWRAVEFDADGVARCPRPSADYLPPCWQAGEIIRERCTAEGEAEDECERRAEQARIHAAAAGVQAHLTVPGSRAEEWLDAGQCRDCDEPAFNYRPGGSAQYIMALRNFDDPEGPERFRFGFMSSSDNHYARPGTGYKEVHRRGMTESVRRVVTGLAGRVAAPPPKEPIAESVAFDREASGLSGFQLVELERQASFFLTGGLIAAHAEGRDRGAVWDAMLRREVYGTTGPRILLWFDLLNPPGSLGAKLPMGSQTEQNANPIFQVRAVGSLAQKPGCPDYASNSLSPERLDHLCKGECYNPSDRRRLITRIEVVRIQPQNHPGEPVASLIQDPWRSFACKPNAAGCSVTFEDPDFAGGARDTLYYVRAIEEPAPGVNASNLRCEYDQKGECVKVNLCGGADALEDDCLAEHEPRAWSSPIFVDFRAEEEPEAPATTESG
jgi:hypothetical protein